MKYYEALMNIQKDWRDKMMEVTSPLKTGDLVHVPAEVYRFKKPDLQLDFFSSVRKTEEPMIGLFCKQLDHDQYLVSFHDGEWIVPARNTYKIKESKSA